ncbi:unnamed protein product [Didymodactylos carnosus]|uniref:Reverse transcriptase/retrotransposon-derived protein RNase H-like domain-containing protein n=1 Tax=Didymodactylos carnosus TaxID=1234261 RepID=A0A816DE11_9BILA|nr:unnamed protein product [Didymodactylos carnosus]CAF4538681.1 unnamed protein product [Didymodactylos carnosus]
MGVSSCPDQEERRINQLDEILTVLNNANFQLNPSESSIIHLQMDYLGHTVNSQDITHLMDKVEVLVDLLTPKSIKAVDAFLGAAIFYRKFIPKFSIITAPLHRLTRNRKQKFFWNPEQQQAYEQLKEILSTEPLLLSFPDPASPLVLSTDASNIHYGGILKQIT